MPAYGTFKYGTLKYGSGWTFEFDSYISRFRGFRFNALIASSRAQIFDKAIDTDTTIYLRYLKEGLLISFDPQRDIIQILSFGIDDLQAADKSSWTLYNLDTGGDKLFLNGDDYYDGRDMKWQVGFIPFDVSLLNSNDWDDSVLSGTEAGFVTINDYPRGTYRAYVYATGANGDEDATFIISGAVGTSGIFTWSNISSSGEWSDPIDFTADELGDITYTVARTAGTGDITLGELVIVPLSNSKNFPLNIRNQGLKLVSLKLRGAAK